MTTLELQNIIQKLREYAILRRTENPTEKPSIFFINAIEIACNLSELGISQQRPITKEEEYWFQGSYHMNFWDPDIERNFYGPLISEVGKRNYFRPSLIDNVISSFKRPKK